MSDKQRDLGGNLGQAYLAAVQRDRDVWWPEFDTEVVSIMGQQWPDLIVTKWERNYLGEKRYVETRTYEARP